MGPRRGRPHARANPEVSHVMTAWFSPTKPEALKAQQLREAEMQLLQHAAHAEYHQAMVGMLQQRVERLRGPIPKDPHD